jgi:hypothetical protein
MYAEQALNIMGPLIAAVRTNAPTASAFDRALVELAKSVKADQARLWQVGGELLTVTQAFEKDGDPSTLIGHTIPADNANKIVMLFLSTFGGPQENNAIVVHQSNIDQRLHPLITATGSSGQHVFLQLRADYFYGILALHRDSEDEFSQDEILLAEHVCALLSVLMKHERDVQSVATEATQLNALAHMCEVFLRRDGTNAEVILQGLGIVSRMVGFQRSRLYIKQPGALVDQGTLTNTNNGTVLDKPLPKARIDLHNERSPIADVYQSGQGRVIGGGSEHALEEWGDATALILPIINEHNQPVGVFALWGRRDQRNSISMQEAESAIWMAGQLSKCISLTKLLEE